MAEQETKTQRAADTLKQLADRVEEGLARDGFGGYPDKPNDRDWRRGYASACRDAERALRE